MGLWQRIIDRFTADKKRVDTGDAEALRLEFQSRYHHFKLLLNANNQALEIMADLEMSLAGDSPFGMKFIRSRAMGAYTRVYQIVQHLHELAPGKYKSLSPRLDAIRQDLDALVNPRRPEGRQGPLILPFSDMNIGHADQVGMKMANLGEMANRLQIRVPDGFVITARGLPPVSGSKRPSNRNPPADPGCRRKRPPSALYRQCRRPQTDPGRAPAPGTGARHHDGL